MFLRLPHARGGVSFYRLSGNPKVMSSPRTWGCFQGFKSGGGKLIGLPHARGGVSIRDVLAQLFGESSPRTWGCFHHELVYGTVQNVFPTHVGVFLSTGSNMLNQYRLPHARGVFQKKY